MKEIEPRELIRTILEIAQAGAKNKGGLSTKQVVHFVHAVYASIGLDEAISKGLVVKQWDDTIKDYKYSRAS